MDDQNDLEIRLQQLLAKRGQELVRGLVEEVTHLHREVARIGRELAALNDYQAARDRWLAMDDARASVARLPRIAVIESDQLLRPRDGFYPAEYTSTGVAFRWTGPEPQFSFDIFVDRTLGADLRLEALNCIDFETQKNLTLLADGETVAVEVSQKGTGLMVQATLSARTDGRSTNLTFMLPAALPPPESSDMRLLGIAFAKLTVAARTEKGVAPELAAEDPDEL